MFILDEIAEMGVPILANARFQGERLLSDLHQFPNFVNREGKLVRDLMGRGLAS